MRCWFSEVNLGGEKEQLLHSIFQFPKVIVKKPEERLDRLTVTHKCQNLAQL